VRKIEKASFDRRRGVALVEFALCAVFLIPLFFGAFVSGISLVRAIQATQVSRDAGHMYVRHVDFSLDSNKDIVVRLAKGLNLTRDGGDGVVILTKIRAITPDDCLAVGMASGTCANSNQAVIVQRLYIGNRQVAQSAFGTPGASAYDPNSTRGEILPLEYLNNPSLRAQGFSTLLALQPAELAFVSEAIFNLPDLAFVPDFGSGQTPVRRVYARTIF
jgi:hypothetical protein